jgi:hypothetical protein
MLIEGEWHIASDGVTRPIVKATVVGAGGARFWESFLIDTGADRTVFSADFLKRLKLPLRLPPATERLQGISGKGNFVLLSAIMVFVRDNGGHAIVRGEFAGFIDPEATDLSVLGRDVLNNFDLIISRRRDQILLLAPKHQYQVLRLD